jgi:hypothetical protein
MNIKNYFAPFLATVALLSACAPSGGQTPNIATQSSARLPMATLIPTLFPTSQPSATSQVGCILPPTIISDQNIRYFYWSGNSKLIFYKEKDGQIWHSYDIASGQTNPINIETTETPLADYSAFGINNYEEVFVSPEQEFILFTRGPHEQYETYYKAVNEQQEHYLGLIRGYIKKVDWLANEEKAIIAMEWQTPIGIREAHLYMVNFSEDELEIEIPRMKDYPNIEYLGLTPDEKRVLFVSYGNEQNDVTVKLWDISTNEITSTPLLNPQDLQWVREREILSVSPNKVLFPIVDIQLFDINDSRLTNLGNVSIEPFIVSIQISPDGSSIAYIENETNDLYWTVCRH